MFNVKFYKLNFYIINIDNLILINSRENFIKKKKKNKWLNSIRSPIVFVSNRTLVEFDKWSFYMINIKILILINSKHSVKI